MRTATTLFDVLLDRGEQCPGLPVYTMLRDGEEVAASMTYGQLLKRVCQVGASLIDRGVMAGDRALLLYPDGLEFLVGLYGCVAAGVIPVPAPSLGGPRARLPRLHAITRDAEPSVILSDVATWSMFRDELSADPLFSPLPVFATDELVPTQDVAWRPPTLRDDSIALLQYTSGSTGSPKGIAVSHRNILHNMGAIQEWLDEGDRPVSVSWLPLFHDLGLFGIAIRTVVRGGHAVLMSPISFLTKPSRWVVAVDRFRASVSGSPNFGYELAARKYDPDSASNLDLSHWRVAFNGAEPVNETAVRAFIDRYRPHGFSPTAMSPCYGLAEATLFVAGADLSASKSFAALSVTGLEGGRSVIPEDNEESRLLALCGRTRADNHLQVVDPTTCRPVADGDVGELWISGPSVATGYWGRSEMTAATFQAKVSGDNDGRSYLRTGDLGCLHEGQLIVTGRIKDMMIVRGRNVYPQDLERSTERAHPAVRPGCSAAFATDDSDGHVTIAVEVDPVISGKRFAEIEAAITESLAIEHEVQSHVILLQPGGVLKTSSGKVQRSAMRDRLRSGRLAGLSGNGRAEHTLQAGSAVDNHVDAAVDLMFPDTIKSRETVLRALGMDSLRAAELRAVIEQRTGRSLSLTAVLGCRTVGDLITATHASQSSADSVGVQSSQQDSIVEPTEDAFPLTALQQAYWIGRQDHQPLGGVAPHIYLEFEHDNLDIERLQRGLNRTIRDHDMLRAVVTGDGRQRVLTDPRKYLIRVHDLSSVSPEDREDTLLKIRDRLSHLNRDPSVWPLFDVEVSRLPAGKSRMHVSVDLLPVDARSIVLMLRTWGVHYASPTHVNAQARSSFRDYVAHQRTVARSPQGERDLAHWRDLVESLPATPELPLVHPSHRPARPRFARHRAVLAGAEWAAINRCSIECDVTVSAALCAVFLETLRTFSASPQFAITATTFNRPPGGDLDGVVGEFTNVVPIRFDSSHERFVDLTHEVQRQFGESLEHSSVSALEALRKRNTREVGLPVVFTSMLEDTSVVDWLGRQVFGVSQTPQVCLDHQVTRHGDALVLTWDVMEGLFPEGLVEDFVAGQEDALRRLTKAEAWQAPLIMGTSCPSERGPVDPLPHCDDLLITDLIRRFEDSADSEAVIAGDTRLTYGQLADRSGALMQDLRNRGAAPGQPVAVVMTKGWQQIVGVLGVGLTGAPFLPIDPAVPAERLAQLIRDSGVETVVTTPELARSLHLSDQVDVVCVAERPPEDPVEKLKTPSVTPDHLAYVMYTSGSTGSPKGVMINHRGALNTIQDVNRRFDVGPVDRVLGVTPLTFDLSIYDVFGVLGAGGALVLPDADRVNDPTRWAELIRREGVTVWNSAPQVAQLLIEHASDAELASLRVILLSGDWIPLTTAGAIRRRCPDAGLLSLGGATEGSVWSVAYSVETVHEQWASVPYGRPMANQGARVLDERMLPRPVWVPGSLYLTGAGVADGYWNDLEKTAEAFPVDPASGEQMYRTGDRARWLPDGNLELLGREDLQLKIHGVRLEPAEIEEALLRHDTVGSAVVGATSGRHGARLTAWVIPSPGETTDTRALRDHLRSLLPAQMIPHDMLVLDRFPLTDNGKVDRKALVEHWSTVSSEQPAAQAPAVTRSASHLTDVAEKVRDLVRTTLPEYDLESQPDAALLDLGADSMDLLRLVQALEKTFGRRPPMERLYGKATVPDLADFYAREGGGAASGPWRGTEIITDERARAEYVKGRPGRRRGLSSEIKIAVPLPSALPVTTEHAHSRRSVREFASTPVPVAAWSALLSALRQLPGTLPRALYPSAGGAFPVQVYLQAHADRVEALAAGTYYYDSVDHALVRVGELTRLPPEAHWPANRSTQQQAAFNLLLVAKHSAIAPLYADHGRDFALIEAGAIAQLLMTTAAELDLGLCPIGFVDKTALDPLFPSDSDYELVHSLLGGTVQAVDSVSHDVASGRSPQASKSSLSPPAAARVSAVVEPLTFHVGSCRTRRPRRPPEVLLTGATGFLGRQLLRSLVANSDARVHCLVRPERTESPTRRLTACLADLLGVTEETLHQRIRVWSGDIGQPRLGLNDGEYEQLAAHADVIVHNAATVNWLQPYAALKNVNVDGTHRMLELAAEAGSAFVHTSTVAVFPFGAREQVAEEIELDPDAFLYGGYTQSKWAAERLVGLARSHGLRTSVMRPGSLTSPHRHRGGFNPRSFLDRVLVGCAQLGAAPDVEAAIDLSPADIVADVIIAGALCEEHPNVCNVVNPSPLTFQDTLALIEQRGYQMRRMSFLDWRRELLDDPGFTDNALAPFGEYLRHADESYLAMPAFGSAHAARLAQDAGIRWPASVDLVDRYVDDYVRAGLLQARPVRR